MEASRAGGHHAHLAATLSELYADTQRKLVCARMTSCAKSWHAIFFFESCWIGHFADSKIESATSTLKAVLLGVESQTRAAQRCESKPPTANCKGW